MTSRSALHTLDRAGLLHGAADPALDRIAAAAADALAVPIALVTVVDETQQHMPGMAGLAGPAAAARAVPLSYSLCKHVVASGAPLVVTDAMAHDLVSASLSVTELGVRAYVGLPLVTAEGECVGALCAVDRRPRAWTHGDLERLRDLAVEATAELQTRAASASLERRSGGIAIRNVRLARLARLARRARAALLRLDDRWTAAVVTTIAVVTLVLVPAGGGARAGVAVLSLVACWAMILRRRTADAADAAHTRQRLEAQAAALRLQVQATQAGEARFRASAAASPVGIFHADLEGRLTYATERALRMWGVTEAQARGHGWTAFVHEDDRAALFDAWRAAMAEGRDYEREYRIVRPDGTVRHIHGRAALARDSAGIPTGAVGTVDDVTAQCDARQALVESERRFRTVVESIDQGLLITDDADRIVYANGRIAAITGYTADELEGRPAIDVLMPEAERGEVSERLQRRLSGESERYEAVMRRKDGEHVAVEIGGVPFRDGSGAVVGTIGIVADVTARKTMEAELRRQAFEDSLTGLANRTRLRSRMERALADADGGRSAAVLLVDLDDFKHVNDSLGHGAGDRLLACVADRLLDATRGSDTVARLGGDEFAILLGAVSSVRDAVVVADRVVAAISAPFTVHGREVRVGASVGVAVAQPGETPDDLLRNADLALYRAKDAGRGRHATFAPEMHAAAVERLELEAELRRAVVERELVLQFQPIIELATGLVSGVEALVRWRHPSRGTVPPASFIPIAEATGIIVPLGRWVLEEACRTAAAWAPADGAALPYISVNVSGRQLQDAGIVDDVARALRASRLAPDRLVLEVTESVLLDDLDTALARLDALRALGVSLALDDFGTGYSSLAYLQRLPVDVLKIDRAFTASLSDGARGSAFARAVLSFAAALGVRTVAEGVETAAQHAELIALGCMHGQGWLYARPLDAADIARDLRERRTRMPEPRAAVAAGVAA